MAEGSFLKIMEGSDGDFLKACTVFTPWFREVTMASAAERPAPTTSSGSEGQIQLEKMS